MVMMERFGSPATRLISAMKSFQVPVRSIVSVLRLEGIIERITVIVDDAVVCDKGKILV